MSHTIRNRITGDGKADKYKARYEVAKFSCNVEIPESKNTTGVLRGKSKLTDDNTD